MAAPRLTTCQVPPCSNPSFDTFVASRATTSDTCGAVGDNKQMSVVDILQDIKTSESVRVHAYDERRSQGPPGCKPVLCPKVRYLKMIAQSIFDKASNTL